MSKAKRPPAMVSAGGRGSHQRIWEAIRQHRDSFDYLIIESDAEVSRSGCEVYIRSLIKAGFVQRLPDKDKHRYTQARFSLIKDAGVEYPRVNSRGELIPRDLRHENMWRTMRLAGEFSSAELAALASTDAWPIADSTASCYVRELLQAGYLIQLETTNKIHKRYRFVKSKYTGPRPPVVGKRAYVYDPNLDKVVWQAEVTADECE